MEGGNQFLPGRHGPIGKIGIVVEIPVERRGDRLGFEFFGFVGRFVMFFDDGRSSFAFLVAASAPAP